MASRRALLLASAVTLGAAVAPRPAQAQFVTPSQTQAQYHFQQGRGLYDQRRYAEALTEFRAAQALVSSPNTLLYIGLCQRELPGGGALAYRELRRAEMEAQQRAASEPRYAQTVTLARNAANGLLPRLAVMTIATPSVPPNAVVRVNGNAVDSALWNTDIVYDPGDISVEAEAPGRTPFRANAVLRAGMHTRVQVALSPGGGAAASGASNVQESPQSGTPREGWSVDVGQNPAPQPQQTTSEPSGSPLVPIGAVTLGVGVALVLTGAISGALALAQYGALQRDCPSGPCNVPDLESRVSTGNTEVTVANVGLIGGSIVLVIGGVLYGVGRAQDVGLTALPTMARATPFVDPMTGVVGIRGTF